MEIKAPLRRLKVRILRKLGMLGETWSDGTSSEVKFWRSALENPDMAWNRENYDFRLNPDSELQPELRAVLNGSVSDPVTILDVGAGPLSSLGKIWPGRKVEITAVDPLAEQYDKILAEVRLTPPVRTVFSEAEKLADVFPKASFDMAFASNSLDHSRNPLDAIFQMLQVTKPGGFVYLWHFANEGEAEGYHGMHQWNFNLKGDDFIIGDGKSNLSLKSELGTQGTLSVSTTSAFGKEVIVAIIAKS